MFYSININQNIEKIIDMTYKMIKNLSEKCRFRTRAEKQVKKAWS